MKPEILKHEFKVIFTHSALVNKKMALPKRNVIIQFFSDIFSSKMCFSGLHFLRPCYNGILTYFW